MTTEHIQTIRKLIRDKNQDRNRCNRSAQDGYFFTYEELSEFIESSREHSERTFGFEEVLIFMLLLPIPIITLATILVFIIHGKG